ncbi:MAG TPA: Sec-independent protein translocase protein TatB [Hyphomicrobium sp.]|nr:Sec-independent protein translocase protein TatB [Hyphomicrobium sp.]
MFDITSSKLLILAIVALVVVGPKDLPILLRTVGKYLGFVRRQAAEFRQHFDEALKEAELDQLKNEFDNVSREVRETVAAGSDAMDKQIAAAASEAPERAGAGTAAPALTSNPTAPEAEPSGAVEGVADHLDGPGRGAA